jgi:hypothetical protein
MNYTNIHMFVYESQSKNAKLILEGVQLLHKFQEV